MPKPDDPSHVIEPEHVRDDFVTDFCPIETVGPCARFTMVVEAAAPDASTELLVVRKLMIPIERLPEMMEKTALFLQRYYAEQVRPASGVVLN